MKKLQRRAQPAVPSDVLLAVHVVNDDSKAHTPRRLLSQAGPQSWGRALLIAIVVLTVCREAVRFCVTRCYLIDWTAVTLLSRVPVVHTQLELDAHIANHEPALLSEALQQWPALRRWSPEWFGTHQTLGARRVEIFFWGRSGADWRRTRVYVLTLAQYAALLSTYERRVATLGREHAGPAPYLQEDESLFADNEEILLADVGGFPFRPFLVDAVPSAGAAAAAPARRAPGRGAWRRTGVQTETAFWMGPTNARTGIHWDSVDALLHQIHGTKTLTLWPPSSRDDLYVSSKYNHGAELSLVDATAPNLTRFPRFAHAPALTVELRAGSALYLPAGWWHAVTSRDTTISLALRAQGACERRAALFDDVLQWLHVHGLYRVGNCVCHRADEQRQRMGGASAVAGEDGDDGLSAAVEDLLRVAGVDVRAAETASVDGDGGGDDDDR